MRIFLASLCTGIWLLVNPVCVQAAGFSVSINVVHQEDEITAGELWWNNVLLYRLKLCQAEALPVLATDTMKNDLVLVPDIVDGMFMIKLDR